MKKLFYILFICLWALSANATVHYVTYSGAGSANGSSIGNAFSWSDFLDGGNWDANANTDNNVIGPGETVYLSGTFNIGTGNHDIPGGGTSGNYIIIDGDDGVNTAATINPTWSTANNQFSVRTDGNDYLEIRDITFSGGSGCALFVNNSSYVKVNSLTMNGNFNRGVMVSWADHIWIYENDLTSTNQASGAGASPSGIQMSRDTSYVYIHNNTLTDWWHDGVGLVNITDTPVWDPVHHVYVYDNYFELPTMDYGRAFDVTGEDDGWAYDVYFYNNYIDSMRTKTQISNADYVYIYNNIFYNTLNCCELATDYGCTYDEAGTTCSVTFDYLKTGAHLSVETQYGDTTYIYIYNNTFWKSAEAAIFLTVAHNNIDNLHIKNNVIYDGANASSHITDDPLGSVAPQVDHTIYAQGDVTYNFTNTTVTHNVIYSPTEADTVRWEGTDYTTTEFNGLSFASNNVSTAPTLTDPDNNDFRISAGSNVIDAGTDLGNVGTPLASPGSYTDGWNPNTPTPMPPSTVATLSRDDEGWDIGVYLYTGVVAAQQIQGVKLIGGCVNCQ